jgi:hypothetical protein
LGDGVKTGAGAACEDDAFAICHGRGLRGWIPGQARDDKFR